jgi:hypothetical protein
MEHNIGSLTLARFSSEEDINPCDISYFQVKKQPKELYYNQILYETHLLSFNSVIYSVTYIIN